MGGADKPLLDLAGRRMIERIVAALDARHIAISANGDPARFAALGLPVLGDGEFAGEGPLAGVLAGLDWAAGLGVDALLTVPGDTPFIPPGWPRRSLPASLRGEQRARAPSGRALAGRVPRRSAPIAVGARPARCGAFRPPDRHAPG